MTFTEYKRKINKDITIVDKVDSNGFTYQAFENVPEQLIPTEKDIGNRVWVASCTRTTKTFLSDIKDDGIAVKFTGEIPIRNFYDNEVIIHPSLWTTDRLEFEVKLETKFG